jgi:hypothetical protein
MRPSFDKESLMSEENKRAYRNYLVSAMSAVCTIAVVQALWPGVIPFQTFAVWNTAGTVQDWILAGAPVLAWGFGIQGLICLCNWNARIMRHPYLEATPKEIFVKGLRISVWAGVTEEISFRWLIFFAQIFWIKVLNFLFFGFLGLGLPRFFHLHLFGPLADWTTFGGLHDFLFSPAGWAVGAAMLGTNAFFRDGHSYQGILGVLNSWFIGMFCFWLMFTYGLPAAILIHFLYDLIIYSVLAGHAALRK